MNNIWSKKIQSTELLHYSRMERFNDNNKKIWFEILEVKPNLTILEVGCGSGHFCNMIKSNFPNCNIFGIDLDTNHINFAKKESKKFNLNVNFQEADISSLPFADNTFDLIFSHTVVEHIPFDVFIKEQKRVLKKDGKLIITWVNASSKNDCPFEPFQNEILSLYSKMQFNQYSKPMKFLQPTDKMMQQLSMNGFHNIDLQFKKIIYYMPDVQENKQIAKQQIEIHYKSKLSDALFNLSRSKNAKTLKAPLISLLEQQYEKRLNLLKENKKIFDFETTQIAIISAIKK